MGNGALELVRRTVEAWARRDRDGVLAAFAADAEIDLQRLELPDAGVLHGVEELRHWLAGLFEHFPDLEFEVEETTRVGGWVVARGAMRGSALLGGIRIEQPFSEAILVRGGRIVHDVFFSDPEGAARWTAARAAPLLVAVPNVSEGRDRAVLERIEASVGAARVLDLHADPDHNRSVFTLAARQGELARGLVALAGAAAGSIDLRAHEGVHPHVGALDVMPVVWLDDERRGAACAEALTAAALVGEEVGVPVFLYGDLATRPEHAERAWLRRGGPAELARRMAAGELVPDYGPARAHPSAGAVLAAARPPLIAFNVDLATGDVDLAKAVAAELRERNGAGLPGVRALGLYLSARGRAQVSTNVHDHRAVPLGEIVERVRARAPVAEAELIGLAPRAAFEGFPDDVPLRGFSPERHILEEALAALE
jgi:glutamate formiminotransferase/glutamate formiminotransferase/formiminotetrahydrofolate cyclodeaminase